ncbi:MAG: DUF4126 domain-containing protein [Ardenticatenia bacterium]|nr:DUF4126 domain-containing protein [Ardenticatenia bacterium]
MSTIINLFQAFGLSASAGLNAYIPLLIVSLAARYTDAFELSGPYKVLESPWIIGTLVVLVIVEALADKVPMIDHLNDIVATFIRPAAGALLFATSAGVTTGMSPVVAAIIGLLTAGIVHGAKATARPVVTATTGGLGNPVVSAVEDVAAAVTSLVAIFLPFLVAVAFLAFGLLVFWVTRRRRPLAA